jgi:hypothetical protein
VAAIASAGSAWTEPIQAHGTPRIAEAKCSAACTGTAQRNRPGVSVKATARGRTAAEHFASAMRGVPWAWIGSVHAEPALAIAATGKKTTLTVEQLARAWRGDASRAKRSGG